MFLEDSLWPMNSEAKGPLHMILMEAYFNATRQQPMEPGLQRILVWTNFNARLHHLHTRFTTACIGEVP